MKKNNHSDIHVYEILIFDQVLIIIRMDSDHETYLVTEILNKMEGREF